MLKRLLMKFLVRYRNFMQVEVLAELGKIRLERSEEHRELREALQRLGEFEATVKATEAGILTLALHKDQGALPPEAPGKA
jgi:hypothetical protein